MVSCSELQTGSNKNYQQYHNDDLTVILNNTLCCWVTVTQLVPLLTLESWVLFPNRRRQCLPELIAQLHTLLRGLRHPEALTAVSMLQLQDKSLFSSKVTLSQSNLHLCHSGCKNVKIRLKDWCCCWETAKLIVQRVRAGSLISSYKGPLVRHLAFYQTSRSTGPQDQNKLALLTTC